MTDDNRLRRMLDAEAARRNHPAELDLSRPDPLLVARKYHDESIALVCALFGYGNAGAIVTFLESLDFDLLESTEQEIQKRLRGSYYRFQKSDDIIALFIALRRIRCQESLESIFLRGYAREANVLDGISALISAIENAFSHQSRGYRFLLGRPWQKGG